MLERQAEPSVAAASWKKQSRSARRSEYRVLPASVDDNSGDPAAPAHGLLSS